MPLRLKALHIMNLTPRKREGRSGVSGLNP